MTIDVAHAQQSTGFGQGSGNEHQTFLSRSCLGMAPSPVLRFLEDVDLNSRLSVTLEAVIVMFKEDEKSVGTEKTSHWQASQLGSYPTGDVGHCTAD